MAKQTKFDLDVTSRPQLGGEVHVEEVRKVAAIRNFIYEANDPNRVFAFKTGSIGILLVAQALVKLGYKATAYREWIEVRPPYFDGALPDPEGQDYWSMRKRLG